MTENLEVRATHIMQRATAELDRLRWQCALDSRLIVELIEERDVARRDLAAATTALGRIRELCDKAASSNFYAYSARSLVRDIRSVLPATGDGAGEATPE